MLKQSSFGKRLNKRAQAMVKSSVSWVSLVVGKSRLFYEFTHSHRTQGWLIVECGSVSYGKATPYFPVIDLLKAYFKIQDRDDQREMREKVTGKLLTLDKSLESTLPAFLALLDVPVDDQHVAGTRSFPTPPADSWTPSSGFCSERVRSSR